MSEEARPFNHSDRQIRIHSGAAKRAAAPYILLLPAALIIAVFLSTLAITCAASLYDTKDALGFAQYHRFFGDSFYLGFLWRSLRVAAYSTVITLMLGYPYAYVMARSSPPARLALTVILVVQLFTSAVVITYALVLVFGDHGIINQVLIGLGVIRTPIPILFNEAGVVLGLILVPLPFMIFPIYSVLKNIEANLETAASSLGANRAKIFLYVTLPLSLPGILAGAVLVFLFDLTAYVIPGMLGGGYFNMIANVIFEQAMAVQDKRFAAAISISLLLITLAIFYLLHAGGARFRRKAG